MAEISRNKVNYDGTLTPVGLQCTAGVLYGLNANLIKLDVAENDGTPVDVKFEDSLVDQVVEQIVKEVNPLAFFVSDDSTGGEIYLVVDKSISPEDIQHRVRLLGRIADWNRQTNTYSITKTGPSQLDISGTTASLANMFVTII